MTVYANIHKDKVYNLKKVMPDLRIYGDGPKVFSFEGDHREGYDLTVIQARNGFDLHSPQGLANFLLEIQVFSQGKADRLGAQTFHNMDDLYNQAVRFIVQGRAAAPQEDDEGFILSLLQEPFIGRCLLAEQIGFQRVLKILLSALDKRFNPLTFAALTKGQKDYYVTAMGRFRKDMFLEFVATGDAESDCVSVLNCF